MIYKGKSPLTWMITRGTPISRNLHMAILMSTSGFGDPTGLSSASLCSAWATCSVVCRPGMFWKTMRCHGFFYEKDWDTTEKNLEICLLMWNVIMMNRNHTETILQIPWCEWNGDTNMMFEAFVIELWELFTETILKLENIKNNTKTILKVWTCMNCAKFSKHCRTPRYWWPLTPGGCQ